MAWSWLVIEEQLQIDVLVLGQVGIDLAVASAAIFGQNFEVLVDWVASVVIRVKVWAM